MWTKKARVGLIAGPRAGGVRFAANAGGGSGEKPPKRRFAFDRDAFNGKP